MRGSVPIVTATMDDTSAPSQGDTADERSLTLSERVAWATAYERSITTVDGSTIIELTVFPIEPESELPATGFDKGPLQRLRRSLLPDRSNRTTSGRKVPRQLR